MMAPQKLINILISFLFFCYLIHQIESAKRTDNKVRRLKQQKQQLINDNNQQQDELWFQPQPHSHPQPTAQAQHYHQIESYADEDEYFEELKPPGHTCEDIRIEICRDVGYNVTSMPNFVGHELQSDAELQLQSFIPLISYGCSSQLKFFLCSVYVPMCTEKVPVMIGPCRPLCESVKSRCAPVLSELGFQWPSALNCSKFVPENTIDHMCMEGPPPHESELVPIAPTIMMQGSRHHHGKQAQQPSPPIMHQVHYPDLLYPVNRGQKIEQSTTMIVHDRKQTPQSIHPSLNQCQEYRHSDNYVYLEHPRGRCVARCRSDVMFTVDNKNFIDYWTLVWSSLSWVSCLFTMITFSFGAQRFHYPERAIFYIALCYMVYALAYVYRALIGRQNMSCYEEGPDDQLLLLVQEGAHNPHCTISFLMLYYFGMAGAAWWLLLVICWSLSMSFGWSMQKLSKYSQLYHSLAWTMPALQTLTALVMRAVDADELTGTCYVGSQNDGNLFRFVIIPMTFYLAAGILFMVFSFILVRIVRPFSRSTNRVCRCCFANNPGEIAASEVNSSHGSNDADGAEMDRQSSLHSDFTATTSVGCCGDLCGRLRRQYVGQKNVRHNFRSSAAQTGSGHSLLLPPVNKNHHHHNGQLNNNFCSTVSSTSSYSSSASCPNNNKHSIHNSVQHHPLSNVPSTGSRSNTGEQILLGPNRTIMNRPYRRPGLIDLDIVDDDAALVRSGMFALFYTLPALCVLSTYIYEYLYREHWLLRQKPLMNQMMMPTSTPQSTLISHHLQNDSAITVESIDAYRPNFEVFNMRLFMSLVIGIKTGIWILTAKSPITALRRLFRRCMTKKPNDGMFDHCPNGNATNCGQSLLNRASVSSASTTSHVVFNAASGVAQARAMINSGQGQQQNNIVTSHHHHHHHHHLNIGQQTRTVQFCKNIVVDSMNNNLNDHFFMMANDKQIIDGSGHFQPETTFPTCLNGTGSTMSTTISSNLSNHGQQSVFQQSQPPPTHPIFNQQTTTAYSLFGIGQQPQHRPACGNETAV